MITKKRNRFVLAFALIVAVPFVTVQYVQGKHQHERLRSTGIQTQIVTATPAISYGVKSVHYYFTTNTGKRIEGVQRCPGGCLEYTNAAVIYDPENPYVFEFLSDFKRYSQLYSTFFYFAFYLPILLGVVYGFIRIPLLLYARLQKREA
jgi:hypothetical protein